MSYPKSLCYQPVEQDSMYRTIKIVLSLLGFLICLLTVMVNVHPLSSLSLLLIESRPW